MTKAGRYGPHVPTKPEPKQGHRWVSTRRLPWLTWCWNCAMVPLSNDASRKLAAKPCPGAPEEK